MIDYYKNKYLNKTAPSIINFLNYFFFKFYYPDELYEMFSHW